MTTFKNGTRKPSATQDDSVKHPQISGQLSDGRGGFTVIENGVFDLGLTPHELAVYAVIVRHAGADSHQAWPSYARLMKLSGVKTTMLKRCIASLETRGLLSIEHRKRDDGGKASNLYTILPVKRSTPMVATRPYPQTPGDHTHSHPATINNTHKEQDSVEVIAPAKAARPRNLHFDAIVEAFKLDPQHLTRTESSGIAKVANELKIAGYAPEDIAGIYAYCKAQKFDSFTPAALTKHAGAWRAKVTPHIDADGKRTDSPSGLHIFKVVG